MGAGGRIGRTIKESEPSFAPAPAAAGRSSQRRGGRARRPRLRAARLLRVEHRHARDRSTRRAGAALQPLPRHGAVLADAGVPADRPQPPRGRHGLPHRHPDGLPRLRRAASRASAAHAARGSCATPGYNTFAVGKWHLAPRWEQSASGPFERWPLGLGFERYYGFLAGDTNQWTPELVCDNDFVDPPGGPEDGYHLTEDLADRAHPATSRTSSRPRRTSRSSSTSRPALRTRRTRRRRSGSTATAAASTTAGRRGATRRSPVSSSSASCPPARRWQSARAGCRPGTRCPPTSAASSPA